MKNSNPTQDVNNKEVKSKRNAQSVLIFDKDNIKWMIIGLVVLIIGYLLMIGGKSEDPNVFNYDEVYSFRRITLSPIVIIIGFVILGFGIMKKKK